MTDQVSVKTYLENCILKSKRIKYEAKAESEMEKQTHI